MVQFAVNSAKIMRNLKTPIEIAKYVDKRSNSRALVKNNEINLTSNLMIHYLLKSLVICLCTIGCMFQIATIIKLFFDFPTTVFVNVQTMDKLFLPGITLCNGNRIMLSKMKKFDQQFEDRWNDLNNATLEHESDHNLKKQNLIDEYVRRMMDELTVSEFMSYGNFADDFLIPTFFKCASDRFHPTEPCKKYANVITTAQDLGNCFTLFHRSRTDILTKNAIDSGLSQSPVKRGRDQEAVNIELSEEPFHPNEIIRLKLDFHESEYTTLNEPILGHIIIHDNDEAPVIREKNFLLFPGNYYEFFLMKETDLLLPKPYATDCMEHKDASNDGSEDTNEYLHHPLSRENCIIGCMAQNTMDLCKCWPPELPFMRGSIETAQENTLKWCDWDSNFYDLKKPSNTTWFEYCFTAHEDQCNSKCNFDCRIDRYRVIKEVRQWPATQRIEHSKNKDFLLEMRNCCAMVSIRYWSSEQIIAEFTSYIGGLLSMWIGFSLLGVYDVFESVFSYFYNKSKETNKEEEKINGIVVGPVGPVATVPTIVGYNDRTNYDEDYRRQINRKRWQRKAKVAAIIERWTRSPNQLPTIAPY